MKNIHVLKTDKPSRLQLNVNTKRLILFNNIQSNNESAHLATQNIYITSDEEFNRDEYVTDGVEVIKATPKLVDAQGLVDRRDWKKIILTTDGDLIKEGVQAIDDEFLEWFIKNLSCESVEVILNEVSYFIEDNIYKIIIPKEEPKQHLIDMMKADEELGLYEEPTKLQRIEEAAKIRYGYDQFLWAKKRDAFIAGAKWQQERICDSEVIQRIRATKSDAEARRIIRTI